MREIPLFPEVFPAHRNAGGDHASNLRYWEERWLETRGEKWVWSAKDCALVARARKMANENSALVRQRMERLLTHTETWTAQNASPGLLVSRWNQLGFSVVARPETSVQRTLEALGQ